LQPSFVRAGQKAMEEGLATAGLPTFDGDGDVEDESQHELACNFCFYFIQNNEDEDGHTFGKSYRDLVRCGRVQTVETFWYPKSSEVAACHAQFSG
jgi:hypothetical protein